MAIISCPERSVKNWQQAASHIQDHSSPAQHNSLKSRLRHRLHAQIDRWLDENIANLFEDALQAIPQSRTNPVDKSKYTLHLENDNSGCL